MFEKAGHQVTSWSRLSPKLDDFDVILWAPDDFNVPNLKQRAFLEDWLANGDRTLIYVGRDCNLLDAYWTHVRDSAAGESWLEIRQRQALQRTAYEIKRDISAAAADENYARWFVRGSAARRQVRSLSSSDGWDTDIDAEKLDLKIETQLRAATPQDIKSLAKPSLLATDTDPDYAVNVAHDRTLPDNEILLNSNVGPIVSRVTDHAWNDSEVLVVANGGFLLNFGLVPAENRKLAQRLIQHCGAKRRIVFLESGPGGPPIHRVESNKDGVAGLELFTVWPIGFVMIHLLALGVLAVFVMFPQFGRPQDGEPIGASDFGRHVHAIGQLLSRSQGRDYARQKLEHYHREVKRDSGAGHSKQAPAPAMAAPKTESPALQASDLLDLNS